jgi:hypothetical protein
MTSIEKAKELYDNYWYCLMQSNIENRKYWSKECALIAVDEIINSNPTSQLSDPFLGNRTYENVNYWKDVKKEIEKL